MSKKSQKQSAITAKVREAAKANGLQPVQQLLLNALAKQKKPIGLKDWALKAKTSYGPMTKYVGSLDDETREANDEYYGYNSLISSKLVKAEKHEINGREKTGFSITPAGRKKVSK